MSTHFLSLVEKTANQVISKAFNTTSQEEATSVLWDKLRDLGITKENVDSHSLISEGFCKEGDARVIFCESSPPVLPVPWFRKAWSILSENANMPEDKQKDKGDATRIIEAIASNRPVSQWKDRELVEAYGIDASSEVIDELKKRAYGKAIIAFDDISKGKIDVDITFDMLRESRRRKLPNIFNQDGRVYLLYVVGDFPSVIYEESPLVPGSMLFNGFCDKCEMSFDGIDKEAKQFLRVIVEEGRCPSLSDRMSILGLIAAAKSGIGELRKLFPSVSIKFDELKRKENLPSLKADSSDESKSKVADPFGNHKRH